jgi:hypothetical protein
MIKTEDLPLLRIRIRGESGEVSFKEEQRELSLEEWNHNRTAAFAQVRKAGTIIPHELLDLVEQLNYQALVQTVFYETSGGAGLRPRIKPTQKSLTASEALAFFLRIDLRQLKYAEKQHKAAPARTLKLVPRSVIAEIAMDLLENCVAANRAPGPFLNELLRELLNIEGYKHGASRQWEAQEQAAFIIAQYPAVHTRELARIVKVNPSTVSRWRRSSEFNARVQEVAQTIASLGRRDA